jgi:undecaprenyl-diphosphatase
VSVELFFEALLLGLVEGLTEFLPVSSTGHLILFGDLLGFQGPPGKVFEIVIQFGSIAAVCWLYRQRFFDAAFGLFREPKANRFAGNLVLAVLPALVVGALLHGFIKEFLFNTVVVSISLIVGGIAILLIERLARPARVHDVDDFSWTLSLQIGFCQVVAMIPGVSRAGATIMGALLLGADRRAATEFSFFLAVPTLLAASVFDLYANWDALGQHNLALIGAGFISAFLSAMAIVATMIDFVSRHGFAAFAWYRILVGASMLVLLSAA